MMAVDQIARMMALDAAQQGGGDVDQTYDSTSANPQSGTAVAQAVSGKIASTDYATQTTGGTIKAWTTTDGSDTILHLATQ